MPIFPIPHAVGEQIIVRGAFALIAIFSFYTARPTRRNPLYAPGIPPSEMLCGFIAACGVISLIAVFIP